MPGIPDLRGLVLSAPVVRHRSAIWNVSAPSSWDRAMLLGLRVLVLRPSPSCSSHSPKHPTSLSDLFSSTALRCLIARVFFFLLPTVVLAAGALWLSGLPERVWL